MKTIIPYFDSPNPIAENIVQAMLDFAYSYDMQDDAVEYLQNFFDDFGIDYRIEEEEI